MKSVPEGKYVPNANDHEMSLLQTSSRPTLSLWLTWMIATSVSATLGLLLSDISIQARLQRPDITLWNDNALWVILPYGFFLTLFVGTLTGLGQGLVLSRYLHLHNWWLVLITNIVGIAIALIATVLISITNFNGDIAAILPWTIIPGLILGYTQTFVLKSYIGWAYRWVLSCGLAWILAVISGLAVSSLMSHSVDGWPFYPIDEALRFSICWATGSVIFGLISGIAILFLVQYHDVQTVTNNNGPKDIHQVDGHRLP